MTQIENILLMYAEEIITTKECKTKLFELGFSVDLRSNSNKIVIKNIETSSLTTIEI